MWNKFPSVLTLLIALVLPSALAAQDKPPVPGQEPPRQEMNGERLIGVVASVGVDRFDIKKPDGTSVTVLVNDQTHYRQQQQKFHLEDLKQGDHVLVRGNPNSDKQFVAAGVMRGIEEQLQRFQAGDQRGPAGGQGGPGGVWGAGAADRTGGQILSINQNQIVVRNPRQGEKTIVINDQTTFTKEGQAITAKDLKVGDRIFASGKEVQGQFVATQVRTIQRGTRPERGGQPGQPPQ